MSGEGSSSIKRRTVCAARSPVLSRAGKDRRGVTSEEGVYGLLSQQRERLLFCVAKYVMIYGITGKGGQFRASGTVQKVETPQLR